MRKDAGLNGDTDRIPQFAWLLFLKAFDDPEEARKVSDPDYTRRFELRTAGAIGRPTPSSGEAGMPCLQLTHRG